MLKVSALFAVVALASADIVGPTFPFGSLGVSAVLGWYLYYDTRHARPAERKDHNAHVEKIMQQSERHNREIVDDFRGDLEKERQSRDAMTESFTKELLESRQRK
jgi:hypothetical protein